MALVVALEEAERSQAPAHRGCRRAVVAFSPDLTAYLGGRGPVSAFEEARDLPLATREGFHSKLILVRQKNAGRRPVGLGDDPDCPVA